jgi:hypothetical protein
LGSSERSIIRPPTSIDGTNTNWDHRTVARPLGETTPMSTAVAPNANAAVTATATSHHDAGAATPNSGPTVSATIVEAASSVRRRQRAAPR